MEREQIIRMAREAGFEELFKDSHDWVCFTEEIERFFQAAYAAGAAAERDARIEAQKRIEALQAENIRNEADRLAAVLNEREACAKVCEDMRPTEREFDQRFYTACTLNANAIRARSNK